MGLMDCIRQTGGAAQGDPSLVTSAVSAIVGSVGPSLARLPDFSAGNNHPNISLATKASNALARVFSPSKASRNQFQPETHDTSATMSNDVVNSSSKIVLAGTTKIAASVSALIVGAVIYGVTSLERVVNHSQIEGRPGSIREDINQLYQTLTMAINNALKHLPFRDACLRGSEGLYDLMATDTSDLEFVTLLELNGSEPQHVLEALQPSKFHWQWVQLRLLLNELALIEKLQTHDMSLVNAILLFSPSSEKVSAFENENNFIQIILTRLLVRPDVAALFSELIHLFGKSLEDSMLLQAKWFLGGQDVLFGRKTIRQRLINIAKTKGFSIKPKFSEPWDQSSDESRFSFASDLIKQLSYIEQQIVAITRGPGKPAASMPVTEGLTHKVNTCKTIKGGSPGLARRPTSSTDSSPPSPAALRASMSSRIQLMMRFLPILCLDREPSVRNMRHTLASVILQLLGSRIVFEDANILFNATHSSLSKKDAESPFEVACAACVDISSVEGLFDRLLLILHELLETLQNHFDSMQLPGSIRWQDGAGSYPSANNIGSGDLVNIRAASWLKGAVRVRTDLTYVGAVGDDDS
ncbi:mediator of RNA polymerase II transcription subunit [Trifolium repens]|nr:mediator of RNA polymerase II transcription subunit [Trifolium repens]